MKAVVWLYEQNRQQLCIFFASYPDLYLKIFVTANIPMDAVLRSFLLLRKSKNYDVITVVSQLTVAAMNAINRLGVVFRRSPPVNF